MRKVIISSYVWDKITELELYLKDELKLSKKAASNRCDRMIEFLNSFGNPTDYSLCRFKQWRSLGYRCAVFEKTWIFAYEIVPQGVIVRDMSHVATLAE
jgi:hypothetical protein